jgi:hypothetical protein
MDAKRATRRKAKNPKKHQVMLQVRVDADDLEFLDAYCATWRRSRADVISTFLRNLGCNWQGRLSDPGWEKFLKKELSLEDAIGIFRRATEPQPSVINVIGRQASEGEGQPKLPLEDDAA